MKKFLSLTLAVILACSLLTACSSKKIPDGTYRAEVDDKAIEAAYGWAEYMEITYKEGKITNVVYNATDTTGGTTKLKSELTPEEYPMTPSPSEWMPTLTEQVTAAAKPENIDGVAGASNSSKSARALYAAILKSAAAGITETVIVEVK